MPELPEVERARKLIDDSCRGYRIKRVQTAEDKIVYTGGTDHEAFAKEIEGRTITGCERKGKTFWMVLDGEGRLPVMHFGMTGMIQLQGQEPTWYRRRPREAASTWPPRFMKFILELEPQKGSVSDEPRELAFIDGRRLGRLRLVPSPVVDHPPVKALGFDPVLSMPTLEEFTKLLEKKKGTIKGVIMDQAFSAGVGNWVADEILYQAQIHPACPVPALSADDISRLHHWVRRVPLTAVEVNADSKHFPEDWLFRWRWSKGRKHENGKAKKQKKKAEEAGEADEADGEDLKPKGKAFLALPDGRPATIEFIEVGGRTTAVVTEVQKMPTGVAIKPKITKGPRKKKSGGSSSSDAGDDGATASESDAASEAEEVVKKEASTPRQKAAAAAKAKKGVNGVEKDAVKSSGGKRKKVKQDEEEGLEEKAEVKEEAEEKVKKARKSTAASDAPSSRKRKSTTGKGRTPTSSAKSRGRGKKQERNGGDSSAESSELSDAP